LYFAVKAIARAIQKQSHGNTFTEITKELVAPFRIPLPPTLDDQVAIAAELERKLSKVESMRQAAGRQADALGVAEQALLRDVFGRSGNSGWRRTSLGHLAEVVMGQSPEGSTYNREGKGLPLLNGPTEFGEDHPIPVQWTISPRKTGKTNDILICVRGNTTGRMNRADQVYCLGRGIAAIHGREGKGDTRFIRHAIRFKVAELLSGSERSTFPNIGKQDIEGFAVSAPPTVAEQAVMADQIEAELRVLNMISGAAARQSEAISALPGAILREAFDFAEEATA
jgi:type I restriction enzyme S subunit